MFSISSRQFAQPLFISDSIIIEECYNIARSKIDSLVPALSCTQIFIITYDFHVISSLPLILETIRKLLSSINNNNYFPIVIGSSNNTLNSFIGILKAIWTVCGKYDTKAWRTL